MRSDFQRTRQALEQQLVALGAPRYDVGIFNQQGGMKLRLWRPQQVIGSIAWLRYQNALGNHIYIRPTDSLGIVLLDDLDALTISRLRRDGLQPAAVVETSPSNFQCWIRLLHNMQQQWICTDLVRRLLVMLAFEYGADPRCADWRHFGRLAGFTNPKPAHTRDDGRQPFVLLRYARPIVASQGRRRLIQARKQPGPASHDDPQPALATLPPKALTYAQRQNRILELNREQPWASRPDISLLDFMIAREMLREGHSQQTVAQELQAGSPGLTQRKGAHIQDYLHRTIQAALLANHPLPRANG